MPVWPTALLSVLKSLLTPLIAIIAVYIAYRQWKGDQLKLKMDRYDRRLRIYQEVVKMLKLCTNEKPDWADVINFSASVAEADFLFGPEIRQYIDEITSRGVDLRTARDQYRDFTQSIPPDYNKIVQEMVTQRKWSTDQIVNLIARNKFARYLNINY